MSRTDTVDNGVMISKKVPSGLRTCKIINHHRNLLIILMYKLIGTTVPSKNFFIKTDYMNRLGILSSTALHESAELGAVICTALVQRTIVGRSSQLS